MKYEGLSTVGGLHIYKYEINMEVEGLKVGKLIKLKIYKSVIYRWQYTSYQYATGSN
jgi:hypothetical protein